MDDQSISLQSLDNCRLAIGSYPHFYYDATNGGGSASLFKTKEESLLGLRFNPNTFSIPPITWRSTRILGFPIIPGLQINMLMNELQGTINRENGEILLAFKARFVFTAFSIFKFPELIVETTLGSRKLTSKLYNVEGKPIQKNGNARLVGVATIPKTGNLLLDLFLGLPNEALAILQCRIKYHR